MSHARILLIPLLAALLCAAPAFGQVAKPMPLAAGAIPADAVCRDAKASPEARAADLLARMTLDEKIGQMTQPARDYIRNPADIGRYGFGSILSGGGSGPRSNIPLSWADMYDGYQRQALGSRLAIPMIYGIDAVHGNNNVRGSTIFPHNIGLGAAGDAALVEKAARITAAEVAATGIDWTFAPCVTVPQDIRWGRSYEGFSEEPGLTGRLGAAAVKGFQAGSGDAAFAAPDSILACIKHFVGDGGTKGGVDRGDTVCDEGTLRSLYLAPYVEGIKAGAGSVMVSFSSWNGLAMHQHRYLVTDVLKGELGFKGFVVSDWAGVKEAPGDPATQIEKAINAGVDLVMVPDNYAEFVATLTGLVKSGRVDQARIDDAARRILTVKFRIGLFERPYADRSLLAAVGSPEHRAVARQAVRQSQVVLKNDGILPLKPGAYKRILVCGSAADDIGMQCGGWTITWQGDAGPITPGSTVLQGVKELAGPGAQVSYAPGADLPAGSFDLAIVVAGELPYAEMKGDNQRLALLPQDKLSVAALAARKIPTVTVLLSGRPLLIGDELAASRAFVAGWLPGSEGAGVADILFGVQKPSGKLSFTWPADLAAVPVHADKPAPGVLFPRGWGLGW